MILKRVTYKTLLQSGLLLSLALPVLADAPAAGAGPKTGAGMLMSMAPMLAIFGIMYFLLIRPQQKASQEKQKMISNLKRGDKVLTAGGLYGSVSNIRGDILDLKVADNLKVEVSRHFVTKVVNAAAVSATEDQSSPLVKTA